MKNLNSNNYNTTPVKEENIDLNSNHVFTVEESQSRKINRKELIQQIQSLQGFYCDMGLDSDNIKTIFSLTLSYLKGNVNRMLIKSFFDVLMTQNRLVSTKEINLLNCFDELIESLETAEENLASLTTATDKQIRLNLRAA